MNSFSLGILTAERLCAAIDSAQRRLIFCAPGVDETIAHALAQATSRLPNGSIYMHVDPSELALRMGYGNLAGINILAALRKVKVAERWRLGLLVVDDSVFLYAPTPEAHERPRHDQDEPNALILHGPAAEELIESIRGESRRRLLEPLEESNSKDQRINEHQTVEMPNGETREQPYIPTPREARLLALVRRFFKVVQFHHSLTFADKKIRLTAKDFGIRTQDIDPQLLITFKLISDTDRKQINRIMSGIDRQVENWAESGLLKSLNPRLQIVWYHDPRIFTKEFEEARRKTEERVKEWFAENYDQVQGRSKALVRKFLNDDLFDRVNPQRGPRHHKLSPEQFREAWIEEQAKRFELPSSADVLATLKIDYDLLDISEQLLASPEFRKNIEDAFDINLDEMLDREEN